MGLLAGWAGPTPSSLPYWTEELSLQLSLSHMLSLRKACAVLDLCCWAKHNLLELGGLSSSQFFLSLDTCSPHCTHTLSHP
jgi:hypothetical protein